MKTLIVAALAVILVGCISPPQTTEQDTRVPVTNNSYKIVLIQPDAIKTSGPDDFVRDKDGNIATDPAGNAIVRTFPKRTLDLGAISMDTEGAEGARNFVVFIVNQNDGTEQEATGTASQQAQAETDGTIDVKPDVDANVNSPGGSTGDPE